jgi:hypothetical protein
MTSPLAYRPVNAVSRLAPGSAACPLSLRHLLAAGRRPRVPLPFVLAPLPAVARAALLAAREAGSALGLCAPRGAAFGPWFARVTAEADRLAPALPLVLAGEVLVEGASDAEVERAGLEAARLVEAGATHVAVDAGGLRVEDRAAAAADVAALASDREIGIELLLAPDEVADPARAGRLVADFRGRGVALDAAGVRLGRPRDGDEERGQARALALVARACGAPVLRRGPATAGALAALAGSPACGCDDGGAALATGWRALSAAERAALAAGGREPAEGAAAAAERLEALAWSEVTAFLDGLGAAGSARALSAALAGPG